MDNHWTGNCILCDAPLHTHEYADHLRLCLLIETKRTGKTDREVLSELRKLQREAAGTATPETPAPHSSRGGWPQSAWDRAHAAARGIAGIPEGHTECLSCFGNKQLYPNCETCDGQGWV